MPEYDGRYEVEIVYGVAVTSRTITHRHTFDVAVDGDPFPGQEFPSISLLEKSGLSTDMDTFIQDYVDVWSPMLGTTAALQEINLWRYDAEPSQVKVLISSAETLPTPAFTGTSVAASSFIFTFRILGYQFPMRMYIMEVNSSSELRTPYGALTGAPLAYANYVKSAASPIVGRSDGYVNSAIALNAGQNEKLRRIRFRSE